MLTIYTNTHHARTSSNGFRVVCCRKTPITFVVTFYLLWQQLGVACIFGIVYILVVLPVIATVMSRKLKKIDVIRVLLICSP